MNFTPTPMLNTGDRYGRLTVRLFVTRNPQRYECDCLCGRVVIVPKRDLRSGNTRSRDCLQSDETVARSYRHGLSSTSTYSSWLAMIRRCYDPTYERYEEWGGRGIAVCERWRGPSGAMNFYTDMGERPAGCSLERINNNGNYEPSNCKWATRSEQQSNKRNNRLVTFNEQTRTLTEWESVLGFKRNVLFYRLDHGWDVERALTTPSRAL